MNQLTRSSFRPIGRRRALRGDIYVFWVIAMPVLILLMAVVIDLGRYMFLRGQVQTAADSAALAAVSQIDVAMFENGGGLHFTSNVSPVATTYMNQVCAPLIKRGATCWISDLRVDDAGKRVVVKVSADLSLFFPKFIPKVIISMTGYAQVGTFYQ